MPTLSEVVPAALDGQRVDRVVSMLTGVTRAAATELVAVGAVVVDQVAVTRGADRLAVGQELEIDLPERSDPERALPEPDVTVPIVFEDEHLVVVDKPADLVVHPGAGNDRGTLVNGLLARFPELAALGEATDPVRPGIVHRLDKGTSGLLVVARTLEAHESLVAQLTARSVERCYRTLVWGHPESSRGVVDAPIGRSTRQPTKMAVTAGGKEARTSYEVQELFEDPAALALLTCELETGRTHQIRVHLSAIGHPVVGDDRYGGARQSLPSARPFLHAERLAFEHPTSGPPMCFASPLPDDLQAVLAQLS